MRNKRKKGGTILITGGLLLLVAALLLTGYNLLDEHRAAIETGHVLAALQLEVTDALSSSSDEGKEISDNILHPDMEMPITEVEGNDYIGILEIPALQLSLPVLGTCSTTNLKIAPCCYDGSVYAGPMVIAGHNYRAHFGALKNLTMGAQVKFTDVKGNSFLYKAVETEVLDMTAVEDMTCGEWDLTLFTCTPSGQTRLAVRCIKLG
ncbi:MAG: sortase [Clostridiales bacterium]|nr:sortase [Clostridiales bacterium]